MSAISSTSSSPDFFVGYVVDGAEEAAPTNNQTEQVQTQESEGSSNPNSTFFEGWSDEEIEQFKKNEQQQFNSTLAANAKGQSEAQDRFAETFEA